MNVFTWVLFWYKLYHYSLLLIISHMHTANIYVNNEEFPCPKVIWIALEVIDYLFISLFKRWEQQQQQKSNGKKKVENAILRNSQTGEMIYKHKPNTRGAACVCLHHIWINKLMTRIISKKMKIEKKTAAKILHTQTESWKNIVKINKWI